MMEIIKNFDEISKLDVSIAGGKGASLGEMIQSGIPVPNGFIVLSDTFDRFIEETGINVEIDSILGRVNTEEIHTVEDASAQIQSIILSKDMPDDIGEEIEKYFWDLDTKFVAVRSSATAEDSESAAWAGQLDTFLNVTNKDLLENVKKCWASLFTPRAIFYRFEQKLHDTKISVAVVVQEMVNSDKSGISFSVHPVTEDPNQLIIEAGFGLGEAVVSGQITPDSYVVNKNNWSIIDNSINEQLKGLFRAKNGGSEWKDLGEGGKKKVLGEKEIIELSKLVVKIEKHYGFPCDVEWAKEKNKFYITQSRPITTLSKMGVNDRGEYEPNDFWVLAQEIPKMNIFFFCMVYYMVKWWPKYNLSDDINKIIAHFDGTHVKMYCLESEYKKAAEYVANRIIDNPSWALKQLKNIELLSNKYIRSSDKLVKILGGDIKKLSRQFKETNKYNLESQVFGAAFTWLTEARYQFVTKALIEIIQNQIKKNSINLSPIEVFNILTKSERKSHSYNEELDFIEIVRNIKNDQKIRNMFLRKSNADLVNYAIGMNDKIGKSIIALHKKWCWLSYGYVGPEKELKEYIFEIKKSVKERINRKGKEKDIDLIEKQNKLLQQLKFNKKQRDLINFVKESSYIKDYRKGAVYHGMYCYKLFFQYISKLYNIKCKYFWHMNPFEIENLLENNVEIPPKELREREKECVINYNKNGVNFLFGNDKKKMLKSMKMELPSKEESGINGMPVCMGHVTGKVKIIESTDDIHKMDKGDILVSHITYPNLLPAMKKASAIITNVGGVICHAAIIARELNIPCIVGTKNATKILKDNDIVEVDANVGKVMIIKKS